MFYKKISKISCNTNANHSLQYAMPLIAILCEKESWKIAQDFKKVPVFPCEIQVYSFRLLSVKKDAVVSLGSENDPIHLSQELICMISKTIRRLSKNKLTYLSSVLPERASEINNIEIHTHCGHCVKQCSIKNAAETIHCSLYICRYVCNIFYTIRLIFLESMYN
jgi:hypothetical protein